MRMSARSCRGQIALHGCHRPGYTSQSKTSYSSTGRHQPTACCQSAIHRRSIQAAEFLWLLEHEGAEKLETYKTPDLTWEEIKYLQTASESQPEMLLDERDASERNVDGSLYNPKDEEMKEGSSSTEIEATAVSAPQSFRTRRDCLLDQAHRPQTDSSCLCH